MTELIKEATMEDSFIYRSFNQSNGLVEKIVKYIKTAVVLDVGYIEEQYNQMKKLPISPLSQKVIEAYDAGDIELLYSRDVKIGTSLPFIIRKSGGKIIATIFVASFGAVNKDNLFQIPVKQLYALMESAYVALEIQKNPTKIQRNVTLMRMCANVYTGMFMRIINKNYSLVTDKVLHDKATYVLTRFFLERIWEYPNTGLIESYATAELQYIDDFELGLLKQGYDSADIKDLNEMLNFIKTISPRMSDLNVRFFIEQFVNSFHGASILAMDYLPYIFFVIINILLSSFLISQAALNDLIKNIKGMQRFYPELAKTI